MRKVHVSIFLELKKGGTVTAIYKHGFVEDENDLPHSFWNSPRQNKKLIISFCTSCEEFFWYSGSLTGRVDFTVGSNVSDHFCSQIKFRQK